MGELTALMHKILAAVGRDEVELTRWPLWHRGATWEGHRSPSLTLLGLHRRGLVDAMPSQGGGPCRARVRLTDAGREVLGEVPADA